MIRTSTITTSDKNPLEIIIHPREHNERPKLTKDNHHNGHSGTYSTLPGSTGRARAHRNAYIVLYYRHQV